MTAAGSDAPWQEPVAPRTFARTAWSAARMVLLWAPIGGLAGIAALMAVAHLYEQRTGDTLLPFWVLLAALAPCVAIQGVCAALEFILPHRSFTGGAQALVFVVLIGIVLVDLVVLGTGWVFWGFGSPGD